MIIFPNGAKLVESVEELPDLDEMHWYDLFLDCETSSNDRRLKSLNPWNTANCQVCGIAVRFGYTDCGWYIPRSVIIQQISWLRKAFRRTKRWINHNIKYDGHVLLNDLNLVELLDVEFCDTIARAKLIDSDRTFKGGYGLDVLARDCLNKDITFHERRMFPYLDGAWNLDYGRVPDDIIGYYATDDVLINSELMLWQDDNMPEESEQLDLDEQKVTKVLFVMERRGAAIKPESLRKKRLWSMTRMIQISEELHKRLGYVMSPKSNDDLHDLLCNRHGMPVLKRTKRNEETGGGNNPSFDADTLEEYKSYATCTDELAAIIDLCLEYRHHDILDSLFWQSLLEHGVPDSDVDGGRTVIHSDYNQSVRSGRMSCKRPNSQQQSEDSKAEFYPRDGYTYVSMDYSQIEFRLIAHYTQCQWIIGEYNDNPNADFHQVMADKIPCPRRPAKTINLGSAYGMGEAKLVRSLMRMKDVCEGKTSQQAETHAKGVYRDYHKSFPELKKSTRLASRAAKNRGYVRNIHGRRCHMPEDRTRVGFNRVCQSDAADLVKEVCPKVSPAYNEQLREWDVHLVEIVHDEFVWEVPTKLVAIVVPYLKERLETGFRVQYSVPIKADVKISDVSWAACKQLVRLIATNTLARIVKGELKDATFIVERLDDRTTFEVTARDVDTRYELVSKKSDILSLSGA